MAEFLFHAEVTVSAFTVVEADSLEEATRIAKDRDDVVLGGIQSGAEETEQWVIEDADGFPNNIRYEG